MIRLVVSTAMLLSGLVGPVAATDTEVITEVTGKIREFVAGMAKGEVQAASVADEQIIAYSSGGMWEYLSGAEFIASMTEGPKLVAKGYHINVRLLGDAKDVAYA